MANRRIEQHLAKLAQVRAAGPDGAAAPLRQALDDRANLVVAKAAKVAVELELRELVPDLLAAFGRLFEEPLKRDPQCWGKNELARALRDLDYTEAEPYLRGAKHVQLEPVWNGRQDTAGALRGVCLLALPACTGLRRETLMRYLVDALTEDDPAVRGDAARAIGAMGGDDSALVLRLKARLGDKESAVTGQVFESLLSLERADGIGFVQDFLEAAGGEIAEEAALAIGGSRMESGVEPLLAAFEVAVGEPYRHAILRALSISRQDRAIAFLRDVASGGRASDREGAQSALALFPNSTATLG